MIHIYIYIYICFENFWTALTNACPALLIAIKAHILHGVRRMDTANIASTLSRSQLSTRTNARCRRLLRILTFTMGTVTTLWSLCSWHGQYFPPPLPPQVLFMQRSILIAARSSVIAFSMVLRQFQHPHGILMFIPIFMFITKPFEIA